MKYLYGFTISGIQQYIFQTGKLKEIAGASELVEQICTVEFAKKLNVELQELENQPMAIRLAAGNIRYIFNDVDKCRDVFKTFPKKALDLAPGINIRQAVVEMKDDESDFSVKLKDLEGLLSTQASDPIRSFVPGLMIMNRSRRTGYPSVFESIQTPARPGQKWEPLDEATLKKRKTKPSRLNEAFFNKYCSDDKFYPTDVEEITNSGGSEYKWLAVIHADGNGIGSVLESLSRYGSETVEKFSKALKEATKSAANEAFLACTKIFELEKDQKMPFRPFIIGGDDLTLVCRADIALFYAKTFLEKFQQNTKELVKKNRINKLENGLSSCCGIAYMKESYPLHYAIELAEGLCQRAKKEARKTDGKESFLMFHKIKDSFVEEFDQLVERELTAEDSGIRFDYGPYDLKGVDTLIHSVTQLRSSEGNAVKSDLRKWLRLLHDDRSKAAQHYERLLHAGPPQIIKELKLQELNERVQMELKTPVYDWLTILSLTTKHSENEKNLLHD